MGTAGDPARPWARGQALVETALVLPVFLLILFGLIDLGRLAFTNSMVSQAAREGARVAAVQGRRMGQGSRTIRGALPPPWSITSGNPGAHVCAADVPTLHENVRLAANGELVGVASIPLANVYLRCDPSTGSTPTGAWTGVTCTNRQYEDQVSVRVVVTYQPITPIVGSFLGSLIGPLNLSGSATMAIN